MIQHNLTLKLPKEKQMAQVAHRTKAVHLPFYNTRWHYMIIFLATIKTDCDRIEATECVFNYV